jgi:predicted nucleic acid-binding protein
VGLVIDTSALVAAERAGIDDLASLPEIAVEPTVMPAIVFAELLLGAELAGSRTRRDTRRAKVEALARVLGIVDFGAEIAQTWARLSAELRKRGAMIPGNDLAVAATAVELGFDVLVGPEDEVHFRRLPALRVRTVAV